MAALLGFAAEPSAALFENDQVKVHRALEKVRAKLATLYERWHAFTTEMLHAGQEAGHVREDIDVAFMASAIIALIEGSLMQSRLAPPAMRLDKKVEPLAQLLARWLQV